MNEVELFFYNKIFAGYQRHVKEKYDVNVLLAQSRKNGHVDILIIFEKNGIEHSYKLLIRRDNLIEDLIWSMFKMIDSSEVDCIIKGVVCQSKSIGFNQK
jgi:hypothetical protein